MSQEIPDMQAEFRKGEGARVQIGSICWIIEKARELKKNTTFASLVAQLMKKLPGNAGDLGWEDPLEKEMETHSGILVWEIPWTEEPGGLKYMGLQKSQIQLSN